MEKKITSAANPMIKRVVRLQRESAARRETGLFCIESVRELRRALDAGYALESMIVCSQMLGAEPFPVEPSTRIEVPRGVLEKIAYRNNPEGFVAVLHQRITTLEDLASKDDAVLVVCSGLEKPGNVGAILRTADAAGIDAVLIDHPAYDLYNPNCVRASTGALFTVPAVRAERGELLRWLRAHGFTVIAASPDGTGEYTSMPVDGPRALVFGAEAEGLSPEWRGTAGLLVRVPMRGAVDSLNVSVTAALLMFEAVRRRGDAR